MCSYIPVQFNRQQNIFPCNKMVLNTSMADPLMTIFGHYYFIYICVIYSSSTRILQASVDLQKSLLITALQGSKGVRFDSQLEVRQIRISSGQGGISNSNKNKVREVL